MRYNEIMKLSADIIYEGLREKYNVTVCGPRSTELVLNRPQFYMEDEDVFLSDHLYLATVEHLPRRPVIQKNAVLVCIGDNLRMKYYSERLCLVTIRNKADFFRVFQTIQSLFDFYDDWEEKLYAGLLNDSDIQAMVRDSGPVFGKYLAVIDNSFRMIAESEKTQYRMTDSGSLGTDELAQYLDSFDLMTEKKGALRIDIKGNRTLSVNLFDREGTYSGCLYIMQGDSEFTAAGEQLAVYLASMLEKAIEKNPQIINDEKSNMKALFRSLVEEQPISAAQRLILSAANHKTEYACICLEYAGTKNRIPAGYICDMFEETFENACALKLDRGIVCFAQTKEKLAEELLDFVRQMGMTAGVSDGFTDLFSIRIYYAQAQSAIENGQMLNPSGKLYRFPDYALTSLIINSLGNLPAEAYFPKGLKEILRHDSTSGVSYLETVRVFLEENLSYTAAAKRLYIHRSTLIDRIARIERELQIDLHDTEQRLLLEMILKAVEIETAIKQE